MLTATQRAKVELLQSLFYDIRVKDHDQQGNKTKLKKHFEFVRGGQMESAGTLPKILSGDSCESGGEYSGDWTDWDIEKHSRILDEVMEIDKWQRENGGKYDSLQAFEDNGKHHEIVDGLCDIYYHQIYDWLRHGDHSDSVDEVVDEGISCFEGKREDFSISKLIQQGQYRRMDAFMRELLEWLKEEDAE